LPLRLDADMERAVAEADPRAEITLEGNFEQPQLLF